MDTIFHEKQEGALCAQHCLNSLLQGAYFTAVDLGSLAQSLDDDEKERMAEGDVNSADYLRFIQEPSSNMDDSGYFSIQVICRALEVWGLELIPFNSSTATQARSHPVSERAFICNLQNHWFAIRKLGKQWFNLNSMKSHPEFISDTYLSLLLAQLQAEGYSIFIVKGRLPDCESEQVMCLCPVTSEDIRIFNEKFKSTKSTKSTKSKNEENKAEVVDTTPAVTADADDVRRKRMAYFDRLQGSSSSSSTPSSDSSASPAPSTATDATVDNSRTDIAATSNSITTDEELSEEEMMRIALAMSMGDVT